MTPRPIVREAAGQAGRQGTGNFLCGKRKREAGMLGGRTAGDTKARLADANGRCRLKLKDHKTRKTIHITFVVFLRLLTLMHQRRQGGAAKPWLTVRDMPDNAGVPSAEAKLAINIMRTTKFSHPDRYQDRVSMEILDAMGVRTR